MKRLILALAVLLGLAGLSRAQALPELRVAVLQIGTVTWELETIRRNGLDRAHGFVLTIQPYADNGATRLAVEGGAADMAVADWIWVARQRAAGKDYVFIPYSRAVGGIAVPGDSAAATLADLAGGRIGIAGGPLDKSWLILRAYARQQYGIDLKAETEQVFGAPPLIYKLARGGDFAAAVNFWPFLAKMKAGGMRQLISVEQAGRALGLDPQMPLLGYYLKAARLAQDPGLAQAFYDASRAAKALLAGSDAAWTAIRPRMNAATEAEFRQLQADWLAGVPARGPVDRDGADRMLRLMHDLGGADLVGQATSLPAGLFAELR